MFDLQAQIYKDSFLFALWVNVFACLWVEGGHQCCNLLPILKPGKELRWSGSLTIPDLVLALHV